MGKRTTSKTKATGAVAYVRVSTEEQATEGVSLDAQEQRIRAYCAMRGIELAAVVIDAGVSAGKPLASRDGGARVLDVIRRKQAGAVVALKLDRLFRNAADCLATVEGWDRAGVSLHLVDMGGTSVNTSSAMGRFFLTVMAGAAEMERNQIRERTSMAMQHKISRGEYTGGKAPYGFDVQPDGTLTRNDVEQSVLAIARELRAAGLSLRAVAADLAKRGHTSRAGKPFVPCQITKMTEAA